MDKKRKKYIESCEISHVKSVLLGGYLQKYAIEGKKKNLPVLICLHGGPGSPVPFSVGCRGLFPEFTDNFIMVYWDQFGCGINNHPIDDNFSIERFIVMTVDLICEIKKDFPDNKLYLFGISWGSILALCSAARLTEEIDGVVVCGQVLTPPMLSDHALQTIMDSPAPNKAKEFAKKIRSKKDISFKDGMKLSKIIRKYTDGYNNRQAKTAPVGWLIKGMLSSPDYRFKDFIAAFKNGYGKNHSIIEEMCGIDLRNTLANISCPYMIFQGETDIVTSTKELVAFVDSCKNEYIHYKVIPNMGHIPSADAMALICENLRYGY